MGDLRVSAPVEACLTWAYDSATTPLVALYEQAKQAQWNATTDIDWSLEVPFGGPLPDDSAFAMTAFEASPLAPRGRPAWDTFRWEFQSWMLSQFLHAEQGALVATARLVEVLPDIAAKHYAASQVGDEARHVEVFARYLRENVPDPYPVSSELALLLEQILRDSRWDVTTLGMQLIVEPLALAAFRLANRTFHDDLIKQITQYVARDEARHVLFGIRLLETRYRNLTDSERAEREEFALEAAHLMSHRFLLADVWERLGIDVDAGKAFAASNELMLGYRQAIFTKVVSALTRIGLMSARVRERFAELDLLGFSSRRVSRSAV